MCHLPSDKSRVTYNTLHSPERRFLYKIHTTELLRTEILCFFLLWSRHVGGFCGYDSVLVEHHSPGEALHPLLHTLRDGLQVRGESPAGVHLKPALVPLHLGHAA